MCMGIFCAHLSLHYLNEVAVTCPEDSIEFSGTGFVTCHLDAVKWTKEPWLQLTDCFLCLYPQVFNFWTRSLWNEWVIGMQDVDSPNLE